MKKRGFTLTEVLGVIIILGVIVLIIFPNVNKSIKKSKQKLYDQQVVLIEDNARRWGVEHSGELPEEGSYFLELSDLATGGYISQKELQDPRNGKTMTGCVVITYDTEYQQYKYSYSDVSCNDQRPPELPLLSQKIAESSGIMTNDPDGNPRYVGSNPSNYVSFNNELWRIIGIFDGQVKIMKDDFYKTEIAWDVNSNNNWEKASLQKELNEVYLYELDDTSRGYIDRNHKWKLGGWSDANISRTMMYSYERGTNVYGDNPTEWEGAIALMYPTDYAYSTSSTNSECEENIYNWKLSGNAEACRENSWMFQSFSNDVYFQLTLTPVHVGEHGIFIVSGRKAFDANNNIGNVVAAGYSNAERGVKPVLYLKSQIKVKRGHGSKENPYILSL